MARTIVLLMLVFCVPTTWACSCGRVEWSFEVAFEKAQRVAIVQISSIETATEQQEVTTYSSEYPAGKVQIKEATKLVGRGVVVEQLKGSTAPEVRLEGFSPESSCHWPVALNEPYVAFWNGDVVYFSSCTPLPSLQAVPKHLLDSWRER